MLGALGQDWLKERAPCAIIWGRLGCSGAGNWEAGHGRLQHSGSELAAKQLVITIDGPAGAGKSTAARRLAQELGFAYLDTGAMYRAVTLKAIRLGMCVGSDQLGRVSAESDIRFRTTPCGDKVYLDGMDVTQKLRSSTVDALVSHVAGRASIRSDLVRRQRHLAEHGSVVLEGRDTGTVVLPGADVKFFLTASRAVRARRRWREYIDRGRPVSQDEIETQIASRDRMDEARSVGPLIQPSDALVLDSSGLEPRQVVDLMLDRIRALTGSG